MTHQIQDLEVFREWNPKKVPVGEEMPLEESSECCQCLSRCDSVFSERSTGC
eukprot:CAMPEP_0170548170 /NCGR_PEP_ID=MMETSP0211-20121228/6498_1 /TAXON_ID=311385 /ORGANISM="Pseudokeronopsis sp., Strain OXSARD2" /LENGTH=51 /DNA_ID=CAMNT_0010853563 /DNA_START=105 /DNA_END=260 /DNA_ORIENTATION=+